MLKTYVMEEQNKKSWFRRNWLWFIPSMGCLTLIILFALGLVGVFSLISDSEPTQFGLEQASKNEKVIELLGEPIEKYSIPTGEMTFNTDSGGRVDFVIPIEGPKGKASLIVKGSEENGEWVYQRLEVVIRNTQERINLLKKD